MASDSSAPSNPSRAAAIALWLGLGLSGTAAVANQVLWQRGLSLVGGAGSLATMLTVLVFMGGLGLGGLGAAAASRRVTAPMATLAVVEALLSVINLAIAWLLGQPATTQGVGSLWRLTLDSPWLLSLVAIGLLGPSTLLMGATMPLSADARRAIAPRPDRRDIARLFAVNAAGAVLGAALTGLWLLPRIGQQRCLWLACGLNASAAALLWVGRPSAHAARPTGASAATAGGALTRPERLGFWLGLLSLGYEMILMRLSALHHGPYPYTFAITLCGFLLCWSLGAYLAARLPQDIAPARIAALTAATVLITFAMATLARSDSPGALQHATTTATWLPVIGFGWLYGRLVSEGQRRWSRDVGRFYAFNTVGACLGVLAFSLLGYRLLPFASAGVVAAGLGAVASASRADRRPTPRALGWVVVLIGVAVWGWAPGGRIVGDRMAFHGPDGVVELDRAGNVMVDGLWHSRLSTDGNHVGKLYNWGMAVTGVLARGSRPLRRALVVGNGVGITAGTLALIDGLAIDAYEVNRTLRTVMARYPDRTLGSASHPRIDVRWMDARAGLLEDPRRYDLIISSPLHLSQAGSTRLLSTQYLDLLKRRLTEGGVAVFFSDEGHPAQAAMVAATLHSRFAHVASFDRQLITLASDAPMSLTQPRYARALRSPNALMKQLAGYEQTQARAGERGLWDRFDGPVPEPPAGTPLITDDLPRLEYPLLH